MMWRCAQAAGRTQCVARAVGRDDAGHEYAVASLSALASGSAQALGVVAGANGRMGEWAIGECD
jgi:hypothetical protein